VSLAQAHLEIARERFLELMAQNPNAEARGAAVQAIEQADEFIGAYRAIGAPDEVAAAKKLKGCRACYGSGGKPTDPCKVCHGTGKVPA
jgi:hypothetical protein